MSTQPHYFWHWAWRWKANQEPAFLAGATATRYHGFVIPHICENSNIISNERLLYNANINMGQWDMWHAFNLCPVIEIYEWTETTFKCRIEK
jgi:hypothetical protein